jgi:hypothetical protein
VSERAFARVVGATKAALPETSVATARATATAEILIVLRVHEEKRCEEKSFFRRLTLHPSVCTRKRRILRVINGDG